jgi:HAD superfamily hydrolase (TIGR01509 family)
MRNNEEYQMLDAVIFDSDGVLVDSEIIAHAVEMEVLAGIGLVYDPDDFQTRFMGASDAAFFAALDADGRERLGRPILDEIQEPIKSRLRAAIAERLTEVPGAAAALACVTGPKAVASSSSLRGLEIKLRKTGLWDFFAPHVYSADHVTQGKPAPDLFLHAARALAAAPARTLVIEDTVNGVTAALAAGMQVWGFLGGSHMNAIAHRRLVAAGAHRIVSDCREAGELLGALQSSR